VTEELREEAMRKLSELAGVAREASDLKTMYAAHRAWNELRLVNHDTAPVIPLSWPDPHRATRNSRAGS
jgi:hypothetical protein